MISADFSTAVSDEYSKCKFNTDNAKFTFTWLTQLRGINSPVTAMRFYF